MEKKPTNINARLFCHQPQKRDDSYTPSLSSPLPKEKHDPALVETLVNGLLSQKTRQARHHSLAQINPRSLRDCVEQEFARRKEKG